MKDLTGCRLAINGAVLGLDTELCYLCGIVKNTNQMTNHNHRSKMNGWFKPLLLTFFSLLLWSPNLLLAEDSDIAMGILVDRYKLGNEGSGGKSTEVGAAPYNDTVGVAALGLSGVLAKCKTDDPPEYCDKFDKAKLEPGEVSMQINYPAHLSATKRLLESIAIPSSLASDLNQPLPLYMIAMNAVEPGVFMAAQAAQGVSADMIRNQYLAESVLIQRALSSPEQQPALALFLSCMPRERAAGRSEAEAHAICTRDSIAHVVDGNTREQRWVVDPANQDQPSFADSPAHAMHKPAGSVSISATPVPIPATADERDRSPDMITLSQLLFGADRRTAKDAQVRENYTRHRDAFVETIGDIVYYMPKAAEPGSSNYVVGMRELIHKRILPSDKLNSRWYDQQVKLYALITHVLYRNCVYTNRIAQPYQGVTATINHNPFKGNEELADVMKTGRNNNDNLLKNFWDSQSREPYWPLFAGQISSADLISIFNLAKEDEFNLDMLDSQELDCNKLRVTENEWEPSDTGGNMTPPAEPNNWAYVREDSSRPGHPDNLRQNPKGIRGWHRASWYLAGKIVELHSLNLGLVFKEAIGNCTFGELQNKRDAEHIALNLLYERLPGVRDPEGTRAAITEQIANYKAYMNSVVDSNSGRFIAAMRYRNGTGSETAAMSPQRDGGQGAPPVSGGNS